METNKQLETRKARLLADGKNATSIKKTRDNTFMVCSGFSVVEYYIFNNNGDIVDIQVD